MAYKRVISYIDLIENEIKRGNAGFIKWEKYDECHILSVFVNGVEQSYSKEVEVLLGNGQPIGKLNIKNGRAEETYLLTKGDKDWAEEIGLVWIPLGQERQLVTEFAIEGEKKDEKQQTEVNVSKQFEQSEEKVADVVPKSEPLQANVPEKVECPVSEEPLQKLENAKSESEKSFWEKMSETHELIYPFGNNTGCFRIFPKDISGLRANYHALRNNQFLMHGYYNYRHLIIWPKKDSENELWLGVPGIYHEREKMAARMFGFEKFEGTKREYRTGDLGYYLITVKG